MRKSTITLLVITGLLLGAVGGVYVALPKLAQNFVDVVAIRLGGHFGADVRWAKALFHRYDRIELFDVALVRHGAAGDEPPILRIAHADVYFEPESILTGKLRLSRVNLSKPLAHLVRYPDGSTNFAEFEKKLRSLLRRSGKEAGKGGSPFRYLARSLPEMNVYDAKLRFVDQANKTLLPGFRSLHIEGGRFAAKDLSPVQDALDLRFDGEVSVVELDNQVRFSGRFSYPGKDLDLSVALLKRLEYPIGGRLVSVGGLSWDMGGEIRLTDIVVGEGGQPRGQPGGPPAVRVKAVALKLKPDAGQGETFPSLNRIGAVLAKIDSVTLEEPEILFQRYADNTHNFSDIQENLTKEAPLGDIAPENPSDEVAPSVAPREPSHDVEAPGAQVRRRVSTAFLSTERAVGAFTDLLHAVGFGMPVDRIAVRGGTIRYADEILFDDGFQSRLDNFDLVATRKSDAQVLEFDTTFETGEVGLRAKNHLKGRVHLQTRDIQVDLSIEKLGLEPYGALFPSVIPVDLSTTLHHTALHFVYTPEQQDIRVEGQAHVSGLPFRHHLVATKTLTGIDVSADFAARIDMKKNELVLERSKLILGKAPLIIRGTIARYDENPAFDFDVRLPETSVQSILDSIPLELIPRLEGIQADGTLEWSLLFKLDTADMSTLEYEATPILRGFSVRTLGNYVKLSRVRGPFEHRVTEPDGTVYSFQTGPGSGNWTPYRDISPWMTAVITTTEDGGFFSHSGFSTFAIKESIVQNLEKGSFVRGASTISQQLAKNLFLSREKTISRKIQEIIITDQIEKTLSKEEILGLYFNVIEFGPGIYGITKAAERYFGKHPAELSLLDCIFLASVIPNPKRYYRQFERGVVTENWRLKLEFFARAMLQRGKITQEEYDAIVPFSPWFKGHPPPEGFQHIPAGLEDELLEEDAVLEEDGLPQDVDDTDGGAFLPEEAP